MPFNLFRKKKQPEQETPAMPPQEEPKRRNSAPASRRTKTRTSCTAQEPSQKTLCQQ